jgi:hypothetical protein
MAKHEIAVLAAASGGLFETQVGRVWYFHQGSRALILRIPAQAHHLSLRY